MNLLPSLLILSLVFNVVLLFFLWLDHKNMKRKCEELELNGKLREESESRVDIALAGADLGLWKMRIHPQDLPVRTEKLQAYLKNTSERYECEFRIQYKQGQWLWLHERGRLLDKNEVFDESLMIGTFFDITARKEMEKELLLLAMTDPLTGLANRRVFQERLHLEWSHSRRQPNYQAVIAMCDIDHFKHINDIYGHDAGDAVLKYFADTLSRCIRENDLAARIGGEEFAVILQDDRLSEARAWAERFRTQIASGVVIHRKVKIQITVSIGLASIDAEEPDLVLKAADNALYRAKHTGRNHVVVGMTPMVKQES